MPTTLNNMTKYLSLFFLKELINKKIHLYLLIPSQKLMKKNTSNTYERLKNFDFSILRIRALFKIVKAIGKVKCLKFRDKRKLFTEKPGYL